MTGNLPKILSFVQEAEKLKSLMRHSWLSTGRRESVAEHSWRIALLAIVINDELNLKIDLQKALKLAVIHDLAEIYAGDHIAWKGNSENKHNLEENALKKLTAILPKKQRGEILDLWQEYEEIETQEAKLIKALDKLETIDQHNLSDLSTWAEEEFKYNFIHGHKETRYNLTLRKLKKLIDDQTTKKISVKTK